MFLVLFKNAPAAHAVTGGCRMHIPRVKRDRREKHQRESWFANVCVKPYLVRGEVPIFNSWKGKSKRVNCLSSDEPEPDGFLEIEQISVRRHCLSYSLNYSPHGQLRLHHVLKQIPTLQLHQSSDRPFRRCRGCVTAIFCTS